MEFRLLKIGDKFRFASEFTMPHAGLKRGPWVKISLRMYKHCEDGMVCTVGSVRVGVREEKETSQ